ncbi:TerB family tellurite resistance protein [Lutimaribacter sp. EGI FJ00015]|uniref:TerB family tellurite resistance protein n=1 Tax=Lutimaribacter degradans TaxID=2945989 RepID=A0ACC5ZSW2_9RHOB|nr:TerB family tellurite resistance protein [Lutimaribacter sp. EGI FJ00013]MCM2561428.1 TerB family tellurite resistance protein [Lutimaribacter sp. EGI FJ00013]MCO0612862.1 TerB family tellurite resistance protein [Lutimaribacter sp. EGI FJ00015]MCO0635520.1 TerB family tellurite resistance protein [Lutimaribacter sp. EGI FJ00014]
MLSRILTRLLAPDPALLPDEDARLAMTALLVRIARTDGDYAPAEIARIDRIARARYGLTEHEAQELREQAEEVETQAPDTVRFTRAIKDAVPYEERLGVVVALWEVVLADGVREAEEDALVRMVTNLLGISDRDSARARQRAQSGG